MDDNMKRVAIPASGDSIQGSMDRHFGRCAYFVIADGDGTRMVENTARDAAEGAGLKAAQLMIDNQVDVVITDSLGPKAARTLEEAGIRTHVGISGDIGEVLGRYREGRL